MNLNHLDLQVPDVRAAVDFFERYFGLALRSNRASPAIAIMADEAGFTLVLQRNEAAVYPEGFHVGFFVDDEALVRERHAQLLADGVGQLSDVIVNNRGVMFYCTAPFGVAIEVSRPRARG